MFASENSDGGGREPVPEGTHRAVCVGLYDLGTRHNEFYNKDQHQCVITWELADERIEVVRESGDVEKLPMHISKFYTLSLYKSHLRTDLESWRGKALTSAELERFEMRNILSKCCLLNVIHKTKQNGDVRAHVAAVMAMPKGMEKPEPEGEVNYFSFDDQPEIPSTTPDWIIKAIKESNEWANKEAVRLGQTGEESEPITDDDSIPF